MAKIDKSLLDLDRAPSIDELRAFFKKHDWSAAKLSDPRSRSAEKTADMEEIKKVIDAEIKKVTREKGITVPSKYLENKMRVDGERGNVFEHQGNSLMELRDNIEDVVSDAVYEIAVNHQDILNAIFSQFDFNDPEFAEQMHDNNPNPEDVAIANIAVEEYWKTLDPKDRIIIKMLMAGFTQKQAAVEVGIANNSGVSKGLSKIRKDITKKTGIKI